MEYFHRHLVFWHLGKLSHRFVEIMHVIDRTTTQLISLLYGEGFHIFRPDVPVDHDEYDVKILMKHHRCFGPFPASYEEIADQERLAVLAWIMHNSPSETLKPFRLTTTKEICQEDKELVLRAMKLDPRDRPTARQLLDDKWFYQP